MEYSTAINSVRRKLDSELDNLVSVLNSIFEHGVPETADKIVIWIPLGHRYSLNFSYMTNDANETDHEFPQTKVLNPLLDDILSDYTDSEHLDEISKLTDLEVAAWLRKGLQSSSFRDVELHKVMAINNVCAYFDLATLEYLEDDEMWD
ncbi:hypothetical protein RN22_11025 [Grimontia sp. AD028]|uniref:hypothetical protein n=1 Tax=Grimontia sp. AD028 TaxID=1581149 RepID=UPI00061A994B|nr:hypothetical protein [Grimontia sp. AD028]KKD60397.1 hypothetical protein RN22_11025 [Grimontia sp. AD028]